MNKILIKWAILVATVSGGTSTGNMIGRAAATPDYQTTMCQHIKRVLIQKLLINKK